MINEAGAFAIAYLIVGGLVAAAVDLLIDTESHPQPDWFVVALGWPFILFVAGVGYLAVRSAQAEAEKL